MTLPKALKPRELANRCNPKALKFKTTAEIEHLEGVIEQDRALRALRVGLSIKNKNYNIYVSGASGTGKMSMIRALLESESPKGKVPPDWCYIHNFKRPEEPLALLLEAGQGVIFKKEMKALIEDLKVELPKAFQSRDHQERIHRILNDGLDMENEQFAALTKTAKELGFTIKSTKNGILTIPEVEGRPLSGKEYNNLPDEQRKVIEENRQGLDPQVAEFMQTSRDLEREARERIKDAQRGLAESLVTPRIQLFLRKYEAHDVIPGYLQSVQSDVLENLQRFVPDLGTGSEQEARFQSQRPMFTAYKVNVVVDNSETKGVPVVFEPRPTYYNLLGRIEKRVEYGIYSTDFTMIKGGSLVRANGGYLVVQALNLLTQPLTWEALKAVIKNQEVRIEDIGEHLNLLPTSGIRPQPMRTRLKVILVGNPYIYQLLYHHDEDFRKIFQIKADFDFEIERNDHTVEEYARFVATTCTREELPPMDRSGVARIVDEGSRMVDNKNKVTLQFNDVNNLVIESAHYAMLESKKKISAVHVDTALRERDFRSSLLADKLQQSIVERSLMIDVSGAKTGQVNGLAVYQVGDHAFGKPVRISAQSYAGKGGVINIDREAKLSGSIHNKGVLIVTGFLNGHFAQEHPLSLGLSITFEQSYGMIDGDSASAAELFAIISSLSELPLDQSFAVTGSVNQFGEVQPVGGLNQKIEGFFKVCQDIGLTGKQGVLIPHQNVRNLMLRSEVIEAVEAKQFSIIPIRTIAEGLELLTGTPAGEPNTKGEYPQGSLFQRVTQKLQRFRKSQKDDDPKKRKRKRKP